jgi:hypothetical protein
MTGRRLYEIVTDEAFRAEAFALPWYEQEGRGVAGVAVRGLFSNRTPAAWSYLPRRERAAWSAAARRITTGRRS